MIQFMDEVVRHARHGFVIIIPVADRPRHLATILGSLLELCRTFGHGGIPPGRGAKVRVVVADDSKDESNIQRHQAILGEFAGKFATAGIESVYFGAVEQAVQMEALREAPREAPREALRETLTVAQGASPGTSLAGIVGDPAREGFRHKGAAVTRNIACLLASGMAAAEDRLLFWFVDSDEQFKVRVAGAAGGSEGDRDEYAIDYLSTLDELFSSRDIEVLTGKVVGDPPVSPAVMAANFIADVIGFIEQMALADPTHACECHAGAAQGANDAAYHDMADLFGFAPAAAAFRYRCPLAGAHDNARCFAHFAAVLDRFFDGEHPTRGSYFVRGDDFPAVVPARTVYTGNYVCTAAGLRHFIPFAPLKLRMAGPVLGRLIRAEIGERFVSANLPLLHTRTVGMEGMAGEKREDGRDARRSGEFRPGVGRVEAYVDLSGEFERQFFGDVMLLTIEELLQRGFPAPIPPLDEILRVIDAVENRLHQKYLAKRADILGLLARAEAGFGDPEKWWNRLPGGEMAGADFRRFFDNIRHNFGVDATGYRLLRTENDKRRREIATAIGRYADDRQAWTVALDSARASIRRAET